MSASSSSQDFVQFAPQAAVAQHVLRLFIAGNNPRSYNAITNIRRFCERYLKGCYHLEIVDIYQQRDLARAEQIIATPTLVKYTTLPKKIWVGDFSKTERILAGLGLLTA